LPSLLFVFSRINWWLMMLVPPSCMHRVCLIPSLFVCVSLVGVVYLSVCMLEIRARVPCALIGGSTPFPSSQYDPHGVSIWAAKRLETVVCVEIIGSSSMLMLHIYLQMVWCNLSTGSVSYSVEVVLLNFYQVYAYKRRPCFCSLVRVLCPVSKHLRLQRNPVWMMQFLKTVVSQNWF
jgi:hypothetical protein